MRRAVWITVFGLAGLLVAGGAVWRGASGSDGPQAWRTVLVDRGDLVESVRASGTLNAVSTVIVGSQLSGQIVEILADFNSPVKAGQVIARLNPDQIRTRREAAAAELAQARADLAVRRAQAERARATRLRSESSLADQIAQGDRAGAQLAEAKRTLERQDELVSRGSGTQTGLDSARTQVSMLTAARASNVALVAAARAELVGLDADIALADAQVRAGEAVIQAREAKLREIDIDLARTEIRSPVDGVVVDRQINLGQTVAASLSAPTLFLIAQDLRQIEIYANVDEADVGRLRDGQPASFTVNAYPARTFEGRVKLVRLSAQTIQNVVTYTAIINVDNADLALKPGMTANLAIVTARRSDTLRVPNAALRFRPAGAAPATAPARRSGEGSGQPGRVNREEAVARLRERIVAEVKPGAEELAAIDAILNAPRGQGQGQGQRRGAGGAGTSPEERRAAFQQARRATMEKIGAALAPERRAVFAALMEDMAAQAQGGAARGPRGLPGQVYVTDADGQPQAVAVRLGINDGAMTEIVSGDIAEGQQVVTGVAGRATSTSATPAAGPRRQRLF